MRSTALAKEKETSVTTSFYYTFLSSQGFTGRP